MVTSNEPAEPAAAHGIARRVTAMVLAIVVVSFGITAITGYFRERRALAEQLGRELAATVQTGALAISGEAHARATAVSTPEFQEIRATLRRIRDANKLAFDGVYTLRRNEAEELVFAVMPHDDDDAFVGNPYGNTGNREVMALIDGVLAGGEAVYTPAWRDEKGTWISAFAPIRNAAGETVGLLEADHEIEVLRAALLREMRALGVSLAAAALLALLLGAWMARGVTAPLVEVRSRMRAIAEGEADLTQQLAMSRRDEIGELAHWFDRFVGKLRELIGSVTRATDDVRTLADASGNDARRLRDGATEQRAHVTQVHQSMGGMSEATHTIARSVSELAMMAAGSSTVMLEMDASIGQVAGNVERLTQSIQSTSQSITSMTTAIKTIDGLATQLSEASDAAASSITELESAAKQIENNALESAALSERASESAASGRQTVVETADGMRQIHNSTARVADSIGLLERRSREIGEILNVIEEVADQTNLLALNAAIIAAQAGEKGKGFNVVAEEIRELAARTQNSTKEIGKLINSVQKEARQAVELVAGNTRDVAQGLRLGEQATEEIDRVLAASGEASSRVREIARSTQEQANASRQAMRAAERSSEMARLISGATQEQAQLSSEIERAVQMVRSFSLETARSFQEQTRGSREVTRNIEAMVELVKRVQSATSGQESGSDRVVEIMDKILAVTNRNFELVDGLSSASERLRISVAEMSTRINRFRV